MNNSHLHPLFDQILTSFIVSRNDDQCDCEKNDWSYYCDQCVQKQAEIANDAKFIDYGKRD